MRTILISGATGFIGKHVVHALSQYAKGYRIVATGRNEDRLKALGLDYVVYDICDQNTDCFELLGRPDELIHFAWDGLPNYQAMFHINHNMVRHYDFLKRMIQSGLQQLTVSGTCFEYGMQEGCLIEESETVPRTLYGMAKDNLHRMLEALRSNYAFNLKWLRLFYTHGTGQNKNSIMAQLNKAIDSRDTVFNMSNGDQLRDYLPIDAMSRRIVKIALNKNFNGVCNICSGKPISILQLVEDTIRCRAADIQMNPGYYSYCDYEPMAFWGDPTRMNHLLTMSSVGTEQTEPSHEVLQKC